MELPTKGGNAMKKIQKTAAGLDAFFKIVYRLGIAAIVFSGIIILIMWYLYLGDPDIMDLFRVSLNFGMIQFRVADSVIPAREHGFLFLALGTLLSIAQLPVFCMMFRSIRGILAPIKDGMPFHDDIVHYLKRLGWLTVANGLIGNLANLVVYGNLLPGYDLGALFLSDKITSVTTGYSFDLTFVIYAFLLFLLSYIFQYGRELQQLSDETL